MTFPRGDWLDEVRDDAAVGLRAWAVAAVLAGRAGPDGRARVGRRLLMREARVGKPESITKALAELRLHGHLTIEAGPPGGRHIYDLRFKSGTPGGTRRLESGTPGGASTESEAVPLGVPVAEKFSTEEEGFSTALSPVWGQSGTPGGAMYSKDLKTTTNGPSPFALNEDRRPVVDDELYRAPTNLGPTVCPECGIGGHRHLEDCSSSLTALASRGEA